jgi:WXXGXW repeat (2 copies)
MKLLRSARLILLALLLSAIPASSYAGVFISVGFAPPALPVYVQPPCPEPGLMWVPGYWAYGDYGYYWVPGAWVPAPYEGALWTPGYWGWGDGLYIWHPGYWGMHVGYYGGINYGYGYMGIGFVGGRWHDHDFEYNTAIMHVDRDRIHHVYEDRGDVGRYTVARDSRVSFNGGRGGIQYHASPAERAAMRDQHIGPTRYQTQHVNSARDNRNSYARFNGGRPSNLVASRPLQGETRPMPNNMRQGQQGSFNNNRGGGNAQFGSQPQNMHQMRPSNGTQAQPQYQQRQQPQQQQRQQPQYQQREQQQQRQQPQYQQREQQQQREQPQYQQRQQPQPQYQQRQQPQPQYQQRQQPQYQQRQQPQQQQRQQPQYQQRQQNRPEPQYQPRNNQPRPEPQARPAPAPREQHESKPQPRERGRR